VGSYLQSKSKK